MEIVESIKLEHEKLGKSCCSLLLDKLKAATYQPTPTDSLSPFVLGDGARHHKAKRTIFYVFLFRKIIVLFNQQFPNKKNHLFYPVKGVKRWFYL